MKRIIVADSSCDLKESDFTGEKNFKFRIAPLTINGPDNYEFIDTEDNDPKILLDKVSEVHGKWSSSCPSPNAYLTAFEDADEVYVITISSKLSGSYNSAMNAGKMYLDKYPNKKVHIIDSLLAASGLALIFYKLRDLIDSNEYTFEQITKKIDKIRDESSVLFVIRSFDTLVGAGRMMKISGMIVAALNICPVCGDNGQGQIKILDKVRGTGKAIRRMIDTIGEKIDTSGKTLVISHCNNLKDAELVKQISLSIYKFKEILIIPMNGLAAFYAGDQGIIVAF
ncbi:MAG: DegV family protein [Clostridia bacterium]